MNAHELALKLPKELRIANCQTCTLAEKMKDCPKCAFNIGLTVRKEPISLEQERLLEAWHGSHH